MRWLVNFLRGMVVLRVTVPFPERFVNLCAQENLEFWAMDWLDANTVRLTARRRHRDRILELAAGKRGMRISGGEFDTERMARVLLDEFRGGKLGKFTLELPGE